MHYYQELFSKWLIRHSSKRSQFDCAYRIAVDPFFQGTEQDFQVNQEYTISEIKMEMVCLKQLDIPEEEKPTVLLVEPSQ